MKGFISSRNTMDDDEFNVVARFDDADLSYPDHENVEPSVSDVTVVSALNETGQRKRRFVDNDPFSMPPDEKFVHPMDWHMKMPLTLEEHENTRAKTDDELAATRLFQRICQARAKRMRAMREQLQDHENADSDDENEKEKQIMESPPIDGSSWIGVNSDDRHERFYIRYIRQPRIPRAANAGSNEIRAEILNQQAQKIKAEIEAVSLLNGNCQTISCKPSRCSLDMCSGSEITLLYCFSIFLSFYSFCESSEKCNSVRPCYRENKARMMINRQERENLDEVHADIITNESSVWVNKYAPRTYLDLLSDDGVNRLMMSWVKLWDECVFKRKIDHLSKTVAAKEKDLLTLDSGKPRRPVQKIALLCGPAGLGKTTLANVVARQAGYAVVEMNASDSRNVPDFEKALEGAVRTSRTLDQKSRPNCLILDEIDGAPVEAIRYLVKATQATGKKAIRRPIICICNNMYKSRPNCLILDEIDGAPVEAIRYLVKATQATGKKAIRRPIICICNNMYTPALRELRTVALNLQVAPTAKERLIQRLTAISELEAVRIDRFALQRLVELCQCDVRFSINTLQFVSVLAQKERRYVSVDDIQKAVERERVGSASIFENWSTMLDFSHHFDKLFGVVSADGIGQNKMYSNINLPVLFSRKGILRSLSERLQLVERVAIERGDDRFVNGLYANYLSVNIPLKAIRSGVEAFVHYDRITLAINEKQDYTLMKFVPVFYMLLHAAVATHTRHSRHPAHSFLSYVQFVIFIGNLGVVFRAKLKYPQQEQSINQRRRESQETLATVQCSLLGRYSPTALLCDVLPLLLQIVQPPIKTIVIFHATGGGVKENLAPKSNTAQIKEMCGTTPAGNQNVVHLESLIVNRISIGEKHRSVCIT
ncbi:unnamed protein product [Haemonchus placei]|uniref:AAA+ ATPase domain-containing protein n=1 Tax=Haemonchus placei TaxID=6290 RepID=A0A3P7XVV5_HAEPC|nr:unnamed protein product [Haemonchus placei]